MGSRVHQPVKHVRPNVLLQHVHPWENDGIVSAVNHSEDSRVSARN